MKDEVLEARQEAIRRHEEDSGMFQGRYQSFEDGKFTDAFVFGRFQILEDCERILSELPKGSTVLDLGCGTGHFCRSIQQYGHTPVGLEPSQEMLKFARGNFPGIEFVSGISVELPFPDNSFDLIICIEVLRYLKSQDIENTYKEMHRVLKPGGKIFATHVNLLATDGYFFYYHLLGILRKVQGQSYHHCHFTTGAKEIRRVEQAGFEKASAWGRMYGFIRQGYKLGAFIGRRFARFCDLLNARQSWSSGLARDFAGHILITAEKPRKK